MAVSRTSAVDHAAHDELLLAAYASGDDLPAAERVATDALVRDCPDCAALVVDLRLIRAATVALPVPPRRRDFRLTDADAARLRPAGWRRLVATFASARLAFTAPLGAGLVAIGIVVAVVTAAPGAGGILRPVSSQLSSRADSFGLVSPAAAGAVAAPELAPVPAGSSDLTVTGTSSVEAPAGGGPAAAQPASPPADVASGAAAPGPSGADAKLPGDAAPLAGTQVASASPGDSAALPPVPVGSASAVDSQAMAPLPGASASADDAGITRVQAPAGTIGSGGAEVPAPASRSVATAPTAPGADGGTGTSGARWITIASLVLMAAGIVLLGLRFVAVRVTSR
jgi:hypothetical protein